MVLSTVVQLSNVGLAPQGQQAAKTTALTKDEALTEWNESPRTYHFRIPQGFLIIKIIGKQPEWFLQAVRTLAQFLYFEPNWDSYGADKIELANVITAIGLLMQLTEDNTPPPSVGPTNAGGVQLEWSENGIDLEIEVITPQRISWIFEDLSSSEIVEEEQEVNYDLKTLKKYIKRLSNHG